MPNEAEKIENHNFNCCPHSFLHRDIHVLTSYTGKEEKSNTDRTDFKSTVSKQPYI